MGKKGKVLNRIIEEESGEITGELREGDRILRKGSIEYLEATEKWKLDRFFKGNIDELKKWMKDLSGNEKIFLFSIVPHISYDDCRLQHENGIDLDIDDMVEITGLPRSTTYDVVNSLLKKDILYRGKNSKNKQYFINPWLFCKGQRINRVLRAMFENYRIKIYGETPWREL